MAATGSGDGDGGPRKIRRLQTDVLALVQACRPQTLQRKEQLSSCFTAARGAFETWLARVFSALADSETAQLQLVAWRKWRDLEQCSACEDVPPQETVNTLRSEVLRAMRCVQNDSKRTGKPIEDASAVAALLLLWMLHANGSLRLEDVVMQIMDLLNDDCEASCLSHGINVALSRASVSGLASQDSFTLFKMTTHGVIRAVLECVVALAFSSNENTERETAAIRLLRQLCSCSSLSFSVASLRMVMELMRTRENLHYRESDLIPSRIENATTLTRSLVHEFLVSISTGDERHDQATTLEIFQAYRLCLAPSTAVQIFRQLVYESHSSATDTTSCFSSILFMLIADFSICSTEFASHSLTLAHQLADDALMQLNASLLLQSLDLAAAVAASLPEQNAIECYETWFRAHFSAHDEQNAGKPAGCDRRCLNAVCSLIISKRQLQFICAFLLEFGHRLTGKSSSRSELSLSSTDQLGIHLRVMKSHQGKHSMEGLIMDFCGQTRSSIHVLRAKEQSIDTSVPAASNVHGASPTSVLYPMKTRTLVQEQVALLRIQGKLSPEVPQWRLFQSQEWKQNILPYCLDLSAHMALKSPTFAKAPDIPLLDQVAFVNELAKRGMVPSKDYAVFLGEAEQCLERIEFNGKKTSYKRRRSTIGKELKEAARQFQLHCPTMKEAEALLESDSRNAILENLEVCIAKALEAMERRVDDDVQDAISEDLLTKLVWDKGFVQVLGILTLDQLGRFFQYQLSVLHSVGKTNKQCFGNILARLIRFGMNQIRWTGALHPDDLNKLCCMCGILAAMTDTNMVLPIHAWITAFRQVDESCLKSEFDSSSQQLRCLISSVFLCARGFLPVSVELYPSKLILPSYDSSPGLQMLIWLAIMSQCHGLYRNTYSLVDADANPKHWSLQTLLLSSQNMLSQQQWCHEFAINYLGVLESKQVKQILATEFRVGIEILIDYDEQSLLVDSLAWIQSEVAMIATVSKNYTLATVEDIGKWIVEAIIDTAQASTLSQIKVSTLLLLLNETMHNAQKIRAQTETSATFQARSGNTQRESFLDFVLTTFIQRIDDHLHSNSVGRSELFNCVMEILALCLHHQIPKTTETPALLERLLDYVAQNFHKRMTWDWLRVLFLLSAHGGLLKAEYKTSTLSVVHRVENSIVVQFALDHPRLRQELANGPLMLDTDTNLFFQWLSRVCSELLKESAQVHKEIRNGYQLSDDSVLSIFPTVLEQVKFKIQVARNLLEFEILSPPSTSSSLKKRENAYLRNLACAVLRESSSHANGGNDQRWSGELACWLCQEWITMSSKPASSSQEVQPDLPHSLFQLLLMQITAELCSQFTGVGRKLLQSWNSKSSGSSTTAMNAVFTVLVGATINQTTSQLESVLSMNGSLWVNEFPRMALLLHKCSKLLSVKANANEGDAANMRLVLSVVCCTDSFQKELEQLLQRVLHFGVEKRIDVLDANLPTQLIQAWPHLETIALRLPILSFTDTASGMLYQ